MSISSFPNLRDVKLKQWPFSCALSDVPLTVPNSWIGLPVWSASPEGITSRCSVDKVRLCTRHDSIIDYLFPHIRVVSRSPCLRR